MEIINEILAIAAENEVSVFSGGSDMISTRYRQHMEYIERYDEMITTKRLQEMSLNGSDDDDAPNPTARSSNNPSAGVPMTMDRQAASIEV
jgi:hypothetical protein